MSSLLQRNLERKKNQVEVELLNYHQLSWLVGLDILSSSTKVEAI